MRVINAALSTVLCLFILAGCITAGHKDLATGVIGKLPTHAPATNDNIGLIVREVIPRLDKAGVLVEGVNGYAASIAVDSSRRPHMLVAEYPMFRVLYMTDNGNWRGEIYDCYKIYNSSQMGSCHIEIDLEKDILWGSGYGWFPSFDLQTFIIPNCSDSNEITDFKKFTIHNFSDGSGSIDPSKNEFVLASHNFQCVKAKEAKDKIVDNGRVGYSCQSGGEKENFWVSKAAPVKHGDGSTHGIWYFATDTAYNNSLRASNGKPVKYWSCKEQYASMMHDMCYMRVSSDNVEPGTAYLAAYYWHSTDFDEIGESNYGVFMNIWKTSGTTGDGSFEFDPCELYLVDSRGNMPKRYAPRLAPAKFGGVFVGYNRGGHAIVKYIPADVKGNPAGVKEYDLGPGNMCAITVDMDGNLHVAYRTDKMYYRVLIFYEPASKWDYASELLDNVAGGTVEKWKTILSPKDVLF